MAVISISRQAGSGGHEIAELVSKKLGYRLFNQELMTKIGKEAGITKGEVVDLTAERHHSGAATGDRAFGLLQANPLAYGTYEASGAGAEDRSAEVVTRVMLVAYEKGDIVIEGRGSQGVLRDKPGVLHVRFVAPVEQRVEKLMKRDNIGHNEARKKVKEADQAQVYYIRRYFTVDIHDPTLYHLIINTGKLTVDAAADLVIKALESLNAPA